MRPSGTSRRQGIVIVSPYTAFTVYNPRAGGETEREETILSVFLNSHMLVNVWFIATTKAEPPPLQIVIFQHVGFIPKPLTKQDSCH